MERGKQPRGDATKIGALFTHFLLLKFTTLSGKDKEAETIERK